MLYFLFDSDICSKGLFNFILYKKEYIVTKQAIRHYIPVCLIAGVLSSSVFAADSRVLSAEETPNYFTYTTPTKQLDDDDILQRSSSDIYMESLPTDNAQLRPLFRPQIRSKLKENKKSTTDSTATMIGTMSLYTFV